MIDPGTVTGVLSLLSSSGLDLGSIQDRLLGMQAGGGVVDPAEMEEIRKDIAAVAAALSAVEITLSERTQQLQSSVDERDRLHASANESHNELVEAIRRRKERELQG
jgi:hypothetical protein